MRFTTKTEYGIVCLVHLARVYPDQLMAIRDIVKEEKFSSTYVEKILQRLRSANIVVSQQGNRGGYTLARPPSQITLREVVEALEGGTFDVFCNPKSKSDFICSHPTRCALMPVWGKTKMLLDNFYGSITLDMIAHSDGQHQDWRMGSDAPEIEES